MKHESAHFKRNESTASCQNNPDTCGAFMLGDITAAGELYIVTGYIDMRKSIDGLCAIVEDQLHMDPRRSALYLFCGKRCDRVKPPIILYHYTETSEYSCAVTPQVRQAGNRLCEFTRVMFCLIHRLHALRCHVRHQCL